ncbi:MAG TPA: DUF1553 domain-containing protein [Planctomycetota bacterium]|nr:DUF1553 domain-containing protein [Planctomycetota bacterium]
MRKFVLPALFAGLVLGLGRLGAAQEPGASDTDFFERKIRPVLAERCLGCHGAGAKKQKGGLSLDTREALLQGGDSGPALVPGDAQKSLLLRAIRYDDPELRMPPPKEKTRLSPEQVADFEAWIRRGAAYPRSAAVSRKADPEWEARRTWVFRPPADPPVPEARPGENPIDAFLLRKLEAKGLPFAPEADRRILLRRASFDLLGLPPTPEEVDAFQADPGSDAFARVVDRMLASPRYGERWGRHWLDLVRYCDEAEDIWRYRDWVIQAFNRDMPYDDFITHQIMGDLLPAPKAGEINADGIIATGVLTIGPWGGLDKKKMLTDIADDQIDLVGRTFLGLTLACARCHDHKYDPITTKDYYGLAGIFLSSHILSGKSYAAHVSRRQLIPLLPSAQIEARERAAAPLRAAEARLAEAEDREFAAFARSLLPQAGRYVLAAWNLRNRSAADIPGGEGLQKELLRQWRDYLEASPDGAYPVLDSAVPEFDTTPRTQAWKVQLARSPWFAVNRTGLDLHVDSFILPPRSTACTPGTGVAWQSPIGGTLRVDARLEDADAGGVGIDYLLDLSTPEGTRELARGRVPNNGESRFEVAAVQVKPGDVLLLHLASKEPHYDTTVVELTIAAEDGPARWNLAADVGETLLEGNPHRDSMGNPGVWSFRDLTGSRRFRKLPAVDRVLGAVYGARSPEAAECGAWEFQAAVDAALSTDPLFLELSGPRSPFRTRDRKLLSPEAEKRLAEAAAGVEALRKTAPPPLPEACGIQEGGVRYSLYPGIQDVPIHIRGSAAHLGDVVPRRFPEALAGPEPAAIPEGSGRRELARWMASPGNPLTARVMVNRIWQYHFGEGLVRTPSNFGKLGEPATHPELLDWLARRFVDGGWSIKEMHRRIMASAAYRQSSRPPAETLRVDPENRLWGRFSRRRLEAEELRDSILAVSGSLDPRPGGRADKDPATLRRMLYMESTRGNRSSFDVAFDAANPSAIVAKRTSSMVAPQALYLMNDPWVLDRIRQLARRASSGGGEGRLRSAYRLVYGRAATEEELALGREFLKSGDTESAPPAFGAWELYLQALVMANEFMFVD